MPATPEAARMFSLVDVVLSARSRAAISLGLTHTGEQVVSAIDGDDAAAHLCVGDVVLSINGSAPSLSHCWQQEAAPERASVLTLRVRRQKGSAAANACLTPTVQAAEYGLWGSFGGYGLAPGLFSLPASLLALPTGDLVVSDGGACRLQVVSPEGELRYTISAVGELPGELNYPAGLATDGDGALFVADRGNCRVQKLRLSDGAPLAATAPTASASHSANGDGDDEGAELLNYPWGIALDGAGRVFTTDMRGRVGVFDGASLHLLCLHTPADPPGSPHGMAVWGDELFIADHDNHRVLALRLGAGAGDPIFAGGERAIGSHGAAPGHFDRPIGLAVVDGKLLVSEFTGRRVQGLDAITGAPLFALPAPANTRLLGVCAFDNRIFVCDFDVDRVHCWEHVQSPANRSRRTSRDVVRRTSRDAPAPLAADPEPHPCDDAFAQEETQSPTTGGSQHASVVVDATGSDFYLIRFDDGDGQHEDSVFSMI